MKVRMGTVEIPEELRLAIGRKFFEPYYKVDAFNEKKLITEYDKTPATHTEVQQYLIEFLHKHIEELVFSEVQLDKEKYERAHKRAQRQLEEAKRRAESLQKKLSIGASTSQPRKKAESLDIL